MTDSPGLNSRDSIDSCGAARFMRQRRNALPSAMGSTTDVGACTVRVSDGFRCSASATKSSEADLKVRPTGDSAVSADLKSEADLKVRPTCALFQMWGGPLGPPTT